MSGHPPEQTPLDADRHPIKFRAIHDLTASVKTDRFLEGFSQKGFPNRLLIPRQFCQPDKPLPESGNAGLQLLKDF